MKLDTTAPDTPVQISPIKRKIIFHTSGLLVGMNVGSQRSNFMIAKNATLAHQ
jgi:hypothetical protein